MAQNKKIGLKIRALHTKLMTVSEIAKETHLSEEEIVKYLEERCLKPIYEHESPPAHEWSGEAHEIKYPPKRRYTDEDINTVAELYNKGITYKEISNITGITFNSLTSVVKTARKRGLIGWREHYHPDKRKPKKKPAPKPPKPAEPEESKEEFCCEVTPETDMDEYMKDRENFIPTKKPLPDIVIESIKGMKDILEAKIEDAEYTIKYCKEQLNELEEFMKENEVCQK